MSNILLIEDSTEYQLTISKLLANHSVITTDDPDQVASFLEGQKIDLILLDIGLPKRDGFSVLQELQDGQHAGIPVICITGKHEVTDKITAFSLGAEDFITKPFHPLELKARVEAKIKKSQLRTDSSNSMTVGSLKIDRDSQTVFSKVTNQEVQLTQTEFKILNFLGKSVGQVYSREKLLSLIWGVEDVSYDRSIDVHICAIRKKLEPYGVQFKAVPGVGYKLLVMNQ